MRGRGSAARSPRLASLTRRLRRHPLPARGRGVRHALFGDPSMNDQTTAPPAPSRSRPKRKTFTGNRALADRGAAALRDRPRRHLRRRRRRAADESRPPRQAPPQGADRPPRPLRAGGDAPLRAAQPEELRHRHGHLSARLLHDEAQSAPERGGGAAARLCRHPSAAADLLRAGRAGADPRARPLAARDHRHACRRHDARRPARMASSAA